MMKSQARHDTHHKRATMTEQLCQDVERLILEKTDQANEMTIAVYTDNTKKEDGKYIATYKHTLRLTRNMMDPVWHIRLNAVVHTKDGVLHKQPILCRNRDSLTMMVAATLGIEQDDDLDEEPLLYEEFTVVYHQGLFEPIMSARRVLDGTGSCPWCRNHCVLFKYAEQNGLAFLERFMHVVEVLLAKA